MLKLQIENFDETELLIELKEGSEYAFDQLYQLYSLRIYRKLLKMIKIEVVAEELTQDVFVKVWIKRHLIDPDKSFKAYLFSIAQHLVYDTYRKISRDETLAAQIKLLSTELCNYTEEHTYFKETSEIVSLAISKLPPQQKRVFQGCRIDGRTYEDVAAELNISISTVNAHIVKATKFVAEYVSKHGAVALFMALTTVFSDQ